MPSAVQSLAGTTPASIASLDTKSFAEFTEVLKDRTLLPEFAQLPDDFSIGDLTVTPKTDGRGGFDLAAPVDINGTVLNVTGTIVPGAPLGIGASGDIDLGSGTSLSLGASVAGGAPVLSATLSGADGGLAASVSADYDTGTGTLTPGVEIVLGDAENGLSARVSATPDEQSLSVGFRSSF